tara:strand:- start:556 stop:882 length:327 start_codon:yes stop_codon:yes gene_type:complete
MDTGGMDMRKTIIVALIVAFTTPVAVAKWVDNPPMSDIELHEKTTADLSSIACGVGFSTGEVFACPDDFPEFTFEFAACMAAFKDTTKKNACLDRVYRDFSAEIQERF